MSERNEEDKLAGQQPEDVKAEQADTDTDSNIAAYEADEETREAEPGEPEDLEELDDLDELDEPRQAGHAHVEKSEGGSSVGKWLWPLATVVLGVAFIITLTLNLTGGESGSSDIVAEAIGVQITQAELYEELLIQMGEAQVGGIVDTLITAGLIKIEADKAGVTFSDAEVEAELNEIKQNFPSDEDFEMALAQNYMTVDILKEQIIMQLLLEGIFAEKVSTDETTLRQYYTDNESVFGTPEQVRASHILLDNEEAAEEVLAELRAGADFAVLASEKSLDPGSSGAGGDLNFFPKGVMHKEFEDAAFGLTTGEMSGVVQSPSGYHIILATGRQQAELKSYEELEEVVRKRYVDEQMYALVPAWIEEIKLAADIHNPFFAE